MERSSKDIYLPNDVVNEILLRLPAKSLGRCKCVCKTWSNLIQAPIFVKNHFHHPQNPIRLFAFTSAYELKSNDYELALFNDESFSVRQDICDPVSGHYIDHILGPVEGLYLMSYFSSDNIAKREYREYHYALWNPSTSEFRELPLQSYQQTEGYRHADAHLGFGSTNEDIKVIYLNCSGSRKVVSLYSLATDSWKGIFNYSGKLIDPDIFEILEEYTATHLNGACYWVGANSLLVFDMTNEVFEVNLPPDNDYSDLFKDIYVRDNSSLVFYINHYNGWFTQDVIKIELWEMKGEGDWIKFFSFDPSLTLCRNSYLRFYGFWKKDEIFIERSNDGVRLYNIYSHENRELNTLGLGHKKPKVIFFNYKESLTSVQGGSLLSEVS